jgi:hypothetical protein
MDTMDVLINFVKQKSNIPKIYMYFGEYYRS